MYIQTHRFHRSQRYGITAATKTQPLYRFTVWPAQNTLEANDGSDVATPGVRVPAAYIPDALALVLCVPLMIAASAVWHRLQCSVVLGAPSINILLDGLVADRCLWAAVLEEIFHYHLLKLHVLCYLVHSE